MRHDLKLNWGITDSIQLVNGPRGALAKNDNKMSAVALYNGITLNVVIQSGPYNWDLFVKLPGKSSASTVTLREVSQHIIELTRNIIMTIDSCRVKHVKICIGE